MSAVFQEFHQWESAPAYKLLTDNRDLYQLQSQRTRNGVVAPFPQGRPSATPPLSHGRAALSSFEVK